MVDVDDEGGSAHDLFQSIHSVLYALPDSTQIFVGHDYLPNRPLLYASTVGEQKKVNKHVNMTVSEDAFIKMRSDRDKALGMPKLLYPALQVHFF
jgi:glyoxylase-like metal-dependent hydrolase (beta-lactamase superfamily II)